jgi:hypothetical protein
MTKYFDIQYNLSDFAKELGFKFNVSKQTWYYCGPEDELEYVSSFFIEDQLMTKFSSFIFPGEDRTYDSNKLVFDLIPFTAWKVNVRSEVPSLVWKAIGSFVHRRASGKCEICGEKCRRLECHERFSFDIENGIQKLERLIGLCSMCHATTHIGLAQKQGREEEMKQHYRRVMWCSEAKYIEERNKAIELVVKRTNVPWELDLSIIENGGIKLFHVQYNCEKVVKMTKEIKDKMTAENKHEFADIISQRNTIIKQCLLPSRVKCTPFIEYRNEIQSFDELADMKAFYEKKSLDPKKSRYRFTYRCPEADIDITWLRLLYKYDKGMLPGVYFLQVSTAYSECKIIENYHEIHFYFDSVMLEKSMWMKDNIKKQLNLPLDKIQSFEIRRETFPIKYRAVSEMDSVKGQVRHPNMLWKCDHPGCDWTTPRQADLYKHKKEKHDPEYLGSLRCIMCEKQYSSALTLKRHSCRPSFR